MPPRPAKKPPRSLPLARRNLLLALAGAIVLVVVLVVASLAFRGSDDEGPAVVPTERDSSAYLDGIPQNGAILGDPSAELTLIQYEDLQCPICKQYTEGGFEGIVAEYVRSGDVKIRFVGLAFIGPDSEKALRYVLAAGEQGKLWQMNDTLYRRQGDENAGWVTDGLLENVAAELELDFAKLRTAASSASVTQTLDSMSAEATRREIPGTPWFYVQVGDGDPYEVRPTSLDFGAFEAILDAARG